LNRINSRTFLALFGLVIW